MHGTINYRVMAIFCPEYKKLLRNMKLQCLKLFIMTKKKRIFLRISVKFQLWVPLNAFSVPHPHARCSGGIPFLATCLVFCSQWRSGCVFLITAFFLEVLARERYLSQNPRGRNRILWDPVTGWPCADTDVRSIDETDVHLGFSGLRHANVAVPRLFGKL